MREKDMKEKIISVARDVFTSFGFKKTSMEMISKKLGVTKSSLYYYFKDKEDIFKEIIEREAKEIIDKIEKSIERIEDPEKKLKEYFNVRMRFFLNIANRFKTFKEEYFEEYNFIGRIRKNYDKYEYEKVKEIIEEGVKKGRFVIKNVELTAFAIVSAAKGLEYEIATRIKRKNLTKNLENLIDILFYGIVQKG
uniref:TetR/AcrR family transcriptional regulator n=1 Tax=candidate division WOR-3 bacterium TaxID=2052148 RepID=A0A7C4YAB4_UNCW3